MNWRKSPLKVILKPIAPIHFAKIPHYFCYLPENFTFGLVSTFSIKSAFHPQHSTDCFRFVNVVFLSIYLLWLPACPQSIIRGWNDVRYMVRWRIKQHLLDFSLKNKACASRMKIRYFRKRFGNNRLKKTLKATLGSSRCERCFLPVFLISLNFKKTSLFICLWLFSDARTEPRDTNNRIRSLVPATGRDFRRNNKKTTIILPDSSQFPNSPTADGKWRIEIMNNSV